MEKLIIPKRTWLQIDNPHRVKTPRVGYWQKEVHISEVLLTVLEEFYEREKNKISYQRHETKEEKRTDQADDK